MNDTFLFINYNFSNNNYAPQLTLLKKGADTFHNLLPSGKKLTLSFNTNTRYCTGWHNLETAQSFPCPDSALTNDSYDQCIKCRKKTGFNPAFYNTSTISPQQQARNAQPHFLYLAHFAPGVIKVGISWAGRGIQRLLDQGARSYIIIKEYPSATVARQYEAKIAKLPGIAETLQVKVKAALLTKPYNAQAGAQELLDTQKIITTDLQIQADANSPKHLDNYYLGNNQLAAHDLVHINEPTISGTIHGMIGCHIIAKQNTTPYYLSLAKLKGHNVHISNTLHPNVATPQQASLF